MNHKGGVGKTTTAINLTAGLSRKNKKVLLIDLDPQGNIDLSLKANSEHNIYDVMIGEKQIKDVVVNIAKNFDIITSKETLVKAEYYLAQKENSRMLLKTILSKIKGYDYIILDCPPSLGMINQNALAFAQEAFVPVSTDFLGLDALKKMQLIIKEINDNYDHNIRITRIIPTLYDQRSNICKETLATIQTDYPKTTTYPIRTNAKIKEAPKFGKSIFGHAASSIGAKDYEKLVDDVISMEAS